MVSSDIANEVGASVAKVVPSMTIVGATIFGFTLQEVAAIFGCAFIFMQMTYLGWKWIGEWRAKRTAAAFAKTMELPEE